MLLLDAAVKGTKRPQACLSELLFVSIIQHGVCLGCMTSIVQKRAGKPYPNLADVCRAQASFKLAKE